MSDGHTGFARFRLRRVLLQGILRLGVLAPAFRPVSLLAATGPYEQIAEDDPRLLTSAESFQTRYGRATGHLIRPRGAGPPRPAVVLVHGSGGLTEELAQLGRRLALEGFVVLMPDLLSLADATRRPGSTAAGVATDPGTAATAISSAVHALSMRRDTTRKVGAIGVGWGGAVVLRLGRSSRDVAAIVTIGTSPSGTAGVAPLRVPALLHVAGISAGEAEELRSIIEKSDLDHELHVNDNEPGVEEQDDPALLGSSGWERTLKFLRERLV